MAFPSSFTEAWRNFALMDGGHIWNVLGDEFSGKLPLGNPYPHRRSPRRAHRRESGARLIAELIDGWPYAPDDGIAQIAAIITEELERSPQQGQQDHFLEQFEGCPIITGEKP